MMGITKRDDLYELEEAMRVSRKWRVISAALLMMMAIALSVSAIAFADAQRSAVMSQPMMGSNMRGAQFRTPNAMAFREHMRQLWDDHGVWTRLVIIDVAAGLPGLNLTVNRLMQNQVDIGNAIKPYYGAAAGDKLTSLLKKHIQIAYDILAASKAGDTAKATDARNRWYANGDDIAVFLSQANPRYWPLKKTKALMKTHLDTTLDEATARLQGNWSADIIDYDKAHEHLLVMADVLSSGIIRQFPEKFARGK